MQLWFGLGFELQFLSGRLPLACSWLSKPTRTLHISAALPKKGEWLCTCRKTISASRDSPQNLRHSGHYDLFRSGKPYFGQIPIRFPSMVIRVFSPSVCLVRDDFFFRSHSEPLVESGEAEVPDEKNRCPDSPTCKTIAATRIKNASLNKYDIAVAPAFRPESHYNRLMGYFDLVFRYRTILSIEVAIPPNCIATPANVPAPADVPRASPIPAPTKPQIRAAPKM